MKIMLISPPWRTTSPPRSTLRRLIEKVTVCGDRFTVEFKSGVTVEFEGKYARKTDPAGKPDKEKPSEKIGGDGYHYGTGSGDPAWRLGRSVYDSRGLLLI